MFIPDMKKKVSKKNLQISKVPNFKMKWIGDRVSYKNHENFFTMIITPKKEGWKMWAMIIWLIAWIFCGVIVIHSLFFNEDIIDSKLYFSTFLLFWAYFLYKIFRVLLWRKWY